MGCNSSRAVDTQPLKTDEQAQTQLASHASDIRSRLEVSRRLMASEATTASDGSALHPDFDLLRQQTPAVEDPPNSQGKSFKAMATIAARANAFSVKTSCFSKAEQILLRALVGAWHVLVEVGELQDAQAVSADNEGALVDPHLICKVLPAGKKAIVFVDHCILQASHPWPRCQEILADTPQLVEPRPASSDLVLAVSHMWFHQKHPDPYGEKASICWELVKQAENAKRAASATHARTLLFFDFFSMTQRPFLEGQVPRTASEERGFSLALKAMPMIYLYSDAIVLLDSGPELCPDDGAYGPRAQSLPSERGWIYLERFIAIVKVAMTGAGFDAQLEKATGVIFSDSLELLQEILLEGEALKVSARAGKRELQAALKVHVNKLKRKSFAATSIDKKSNTGGTSGFTEVLPDRIIVQSIMRDLVAELREHWERIAQGESYSLQGMLISKFQAHFQSFQTASLWSGFLPTAEQTANKTLLRSKSLERFVSPGGDSEFGGEDTVQCQRNVPCTCFALAPRACGDSIHWSMATVAKQHEELIQL